MNTPNLTPDIFWLARVLTGSDEAAIRCLMQILDSPEGANAWSRRNVIRAAWEQFASSDSLPRFAWVARLGEGFSEEETASLLDVERGAVREAAARAVLDFAPQSFWQAA
jgi:hypothetical protein